MKQYILFCFIPCVIAGGIGGQVSINCGIFDNRKIIEYPWYCEYLYTDAALK